MNDGQVARDSFPTGPTPMQGGHTQRRARHAAAQSDHEEIVDGQTTAEPSDQVRQRGEDRGGRSVRPTEDHARTRSARF